MYRTYDETNGMPPWIYRTPEQIKGDIREIARRIAEVNEKLNIRELLAEAMENENTVSPERSPEKISELLKYALEALDELKELNEALDALKSELLESISVMR